LKIDLPEFHGLLQPGEFLEWLSAIEKLFDYKVTPKNQCVKLVATWLHGYASTWWDKVHEMRLCKGKRKISSWVKMKSWLKEIFHPVYFAQMAYSQFNNLRHDSKSVIDYTEEFYQLMAHNDILLS
jgi:hypothetical protein